ncbi:hypothetical protein HHI36_022404 [Cryptolaemus montrouzieri]|uniref:Uncharacterized protein n=1 Tax=Cryptolaemus montrouzieri TaxID=559131 RepID=A0ABD2MZV6_9CUCU
MTERSRSRTRIEEGVLTSPDPVLRRARSQRRAGSSTANIYQGRTTRAKQVLEFILVRLEFTAITVDSDQDFEVAVNGYQGYFTNKPSILEIMPRYEISSLLAFLRKMRENNFASTASSQQQDALYSPDTYCPYSEHR